MNSKSTSDNFTYLESSIPLQLNITSLNTLVPIENTLPLGPNDAKYLYASLLYNKCLNEIKKDTLIDRLNEDKCKSSLFL
jgi:hypothetical protein